jgi:hypothetical protein
MDPSFSACAVVDCVDECDCPDPPATGDAPVTCGDILFGGGTACYLDCSNDEECPDGMQCFGSFICLWPQTACMGPFPDGDYEDCENLGIGACNDASAICIVDDPMTPTVSVCGFTDCSDSCDCPEAPVGSEAQPTCGPILDDGDTNACYLDCSHGESCPAGMSCLDGFICVW